MFDKLRRSVRGKLVRVVEEVVERQLDRVITAIHEAEARSRRDLDAAGDREAVASSSRFARERMPTVPVFHHPYATLEHALELAPADGMALEFGVHTGHTLEIISKARDGNQVYGFDSFRGLPEDWRTHFPTGTFEVDAIPQVPGAELVVGWFDETLPGFLAEHPEPAAFVHIDSDLYSSACTVLDQLEPRLRAGTVIIFDEYFNFPGWEHHEHRAWQEFVERTGIRFSYEAYTANNEQVVVRITELAGD